MLRGLSAVILVVCLLAAPVWADPASAVTSGIFAEGQTKRFDYTQLYLTISLRVRKLPVRIELDRFDNPRGFNRLWLNVGEFSLFKNRDFTATFQPSVIFDNRNRSWWGGFLALRAPRLKVWLTQKSYLPTLGNRVGKHITFAGWQPNRTVGVMYYRYTEKGYSPDSYVGPIITIGPAYVWLGSSLIRPRAWAINSELTIRF